MRNNEIDHQGRGKNKAQPGDNPSDRTDVAAAAKFFLAVHHSKLGASRIYRVYAQKDGLAFIGLGPPHPWIDLESARKLDSTHWMVRASQVIRKGVAIAIAGGSAAFGVLGLILLKSALRDAPKALEFVLFVLTAIGVFVPIGLLFLTASLRIFTGRVAYFDSLDAQQIRHEAESKEWYSFWAATAEFGDVSIDPVGAKGANGKAAALLSFTHEPTGQWKLELVAAKDTKAAARAFVQLLGQDQVAVNMPLKKEGPR